MMQELKSLRDFIKDEEFKFFPLQVATCLLYEKYVKDENGVSKKIVYVFDESTTLIGIIENPHWIPNRRK